MKLNGKYVELGQLLNECRMAGYLLPALGQAGDVLHTYDEQGRIIDVPPGVVSIVEAHTPPPIPATPNFGADDTPREQLVDAVNSLRTYLALNNPTNVQTIGAFKILVRVMLFVLRRIDL